MTTSTTLGFCVCGYLCRDSKCNTTDSGYKVHTKIKEEMVVETLSKVLRDD